MTHLDNASQLQPGQLTVLLSGNMALMTTRNLSPINSRNCLEEYHPIPVTSQWVCASADIKQQVYRQNWFAEWLKQHEKLLWRTLAWPDSQGTEVAKQIMCSHRDLRVGNRKTCAPITYLAPEPAWVCFPSPRVIAVITAPKQHEHALTRVHRPAGYYTGSVAYYPASAPLNYSARVHGERRSSSVCYLQYA